MPFRYPTFEAVVEFNRQEVIGSSEEYRLEDEKSLRKILDDIKENGEVFEILEGIVFGRIDLNHVEKWLKNRMIEV